MAATESKTRRVLKNTGIQSISQGITWTLSCILLVLLPRSLGDAGFGKLFFALSYGTIFCTLINLGMNAFLVREVARTRPSPEHSQDENDRRHAGLKELLGNVLTLKLLLGAGVYLLQSVLIYCLPYDSVTRHVVLILGVSSCLGGISQTFFGAFQGLERMLYPNLAVIVEKTILTGGCALLLHNGFGLIPVCWMHLSASVVSFFLHFYLLECYERFGLAWNKSLLRRILVGGLPFLIWVVFSEIYVRIGVMMLSLMTSDAVVGWYGTAARLYATLLFVPTVLTTVISPAVMHMGASQENEAAFARAAERLMNLLLFVAIPISAGTIVIAGPLIQRLYGAGPLLNAASNLQILGFSVLLVCVDVVMGTVLIARGRERAWACMAIAAAVFNPLVNWLMIPFATHVWGNGGMGAAITTAFTELIMMGGALWLMPKGIFTRLNLQVAIKGCVLGVAMVVVLRYSGIHNLFLLIAAGAVFYLPLALLTGVLPREDLAHLRHALFHGR